MDTPGTQHAAIDPKNVRLLKRIDLPVGPTGVGDPEEPTRVGAVVDVETTGLDLVEDRIIELAIRRFRFDPSGNIVEIGRSWSWRESPGFPLSLDVIRLTGIADQDLIGRRIDEQLAVSILSSADLVIAHHARFDRPMVEARLPQLPLLAWACTMEEIDWRDAGFEGRALGWLCAQAGWFFEAHRADGDVDAVVQLLRHERPDGRPLMFELDRSASSDSYFIEAVGSAISTKDALKGRGYRWNPLHGVWWREVFDWDLQAEQAWLAHEIYAAGKQPRAMGPKMTRQTARERYRTVH